jgi:hypothetical protein
MEILSYPFKIQTSNRPNIYKTHRPVDHYFHIQNIYSIHVNTELPFMHIWVTINLSAFTHISEQKNGQNKKAYFDNVYYVFSCVKLNMNEQKHKKPCYVLSCVDT